MPLLVRALRGEAVERTPVWFMRQAGRSLPEYHAVRRSLSLLDAVRRPELAAEITLQPVARHGVDAAILYSDIVVPLAAIGVDVTIRPGVGPVVATPFRTRADVARLRDLVPEDDVPYVAETVGLVRAALPSDVALIGFSGGPFTMASYLVEGGPSKQQATTKALMLADPTTFDALLGRLADIALASLRAQVAAGAEAVQVFESWAGSLSVAQFEAHVAPHVRRIMDGLADLDVPRIVFGVGTGHLLESLAVTGADAVGVDWRTPLGEARRRLGDGIALQGNLDPATLLAPWDVVHREARAVLAGAPATGHVFNLGHGVLPATPPDVPGRLVDLVHEVTA